jgi:arsenate reductase (thioredoxin)
MAEALLRDLAGDQYDVVSAGVAPAGLNPFAVEVMKEIGIDISRQRSKDIAEFAGQSIGCVVTVCDHARQLCPSFPAAESLHWNLPDPAAFTGSREDRLAFFRFIRDELEQKISESFVTAGTFD